MFDHLFTPSVNACRAGTAVAVVLGLVMSSVNAESPPASRAINHAAIEFQQIAPFVEMGAAWGDRTDGAHGTFGRFPGGAASPSHSHSGGYHGVVIAGVMTNPFNGEANPPKMGPGSYWAVPAGVEHVTACVSAEPCLFYFHADSAFDFTPSGQ